LLLLLLNKVLAVEQQTTNNHRFVPSIVNRYQTRFEKKEV